MTLNVRVDNLRRSIRNDRMKQVYDQAIAAGWTARLRGSGHIRMTAPNDKRTFLTISVTASGARSALNVEAVLKRWLREQEVQPIMSSEDALRARDDQRHGVENPKIEAAIERHETNEALDALGLKHGTVPQIPEVEPEVQHPLEQALDASHRTPERAAANQARLRAPSVACPDCGRTFRPGGLNSHRAKMHGWKVAIENVNGSEPKVAVLQKPVFTLDEVVTVANYGGSGGLIEVDKLRDGLLMVARMRGDA